MEDLPRLSITRNFRSLYRLLGWFGLTHLQVRGFTVRPVKWRRLYNCLVLSLILSVQVWMVVVGFMLSPTKATRLGVVVESMTRCVLLTSLVYAFNQPRFLKALDSTTDVINFQLTYEKLISEMKTIDRVLFLMFICHFIHDFWYFMAVSNAYLNARISEYMQVDTVYISTTMAICEYIICRGPTMMTSVFRAMLSKMYFELACRFSILLQRIRQIRYELDARNQSKKTMQQRSLLNIARALEAHFVLREAVREVTDVAQFPLLALMTHTLSKILISIFFLIVCSRQVIDANSNFVFSVTTCRLMLSSAVVCIYILWFLAVSEPCNRIIDLDREFCELVASCLRRMYVEGAAAHALEGLRKAVEERAACALRLDVMGICEIDRFTLIKIMGVVFTYLILLVQFQYNQI